MGHRVKACKRFMMADKRWADISYPGGTVGDSGCGPTACAAIIASNPEYKNITPKKTVKWIKKNTTMADIGSSWNQLTACLNHYGFKTTGRIENTSDMFKKMDKGGRCAILHFQGGELNGERWTDGGHYVAASGYKEKNGKHYFYVLDGSYKSFAKDHEGWFCYEDKMGYLLTYIVVCYLSKNGGGDDSDDSDSDDSSGPALQIDWTKLNPYIISVDRNTGDNEINYSTLLSNHIPAVMIEAGRYFTSKHKVAKTFRNPKAYEQAQKCIKNKLEYGFYFIGRARSAAEAQKELYELSFIVRKYPPTLGVWVNVDLTDKKTVNDIVLKTYEKEFKRFGLDDKYGIYCDRKFLKKISWDKFQDTWWLWLKDKVDAKKEIERLMYPKFFDTDNKSGPIIGDPNRDYNDSGNSTFKQGDGKYTGKFKKPLKSYTITSEYGPRSFIMNGRRVSDFHLGIDLAIGAGTKVYAADGGKVTLASKISSYGNCIIVKHDKKFSTRYAHLESFHCKKGDKVSKGQYIGKVDSTGDSTGNHLHFEVIVNGNPENPKNHLDL